MVLILHIRAGVGVVDALVPQLVGRPGLGQQLVELRVEAGLQAETPAALGGGAAGRGGNMSVSLPAGWMGGRGVTVGRQGRAEWQTQRAEQKKSGAMGRGKGGG